MSDTSVETRNDIYSAIGALESAISMLEEKCHNTNSNLYETIQHYKIVASRANKAYDKLKPYNYAI